MLKLKGISAAVNICAKSDFYIPIDVDFGFWDPSIDPTLYWRTGDLKKTLIEIGIGKRKGEIRSITLVLPPKCKIGKIEEILNNKIEKNGLPLFDTKKWNNNTYLDKVGNFEICIINNSLIITFASNEITSKVVNDRVVFGFDKNDLLCFIKVKDMSTDEKAILEESLKASGAL